MVKLVSAMVDVRLCLRWKMCSCVSDVRGCVCLLDGKVCLYDVIVVCATRRTVMAAKFVKLSDQIIAGAIDAVRYVCL